MQNRGVPAIPRRRRRHRLRRDRPLPQSADHRRLHRRPLYRPGRHARRRRRRPRHADRGRRPALGRGAPIELTAAARHRLAPRERPQRPLWRAGRRGRAARAFPPALASRRAGTSRSSAPPPPRLDIPAKVQGAGRLRHRRAAARHALRRRQGRPVHGGRLVAVDPAPALAMPGVERVVRWSAWSRWWRRATGRRAARWRPWRPSFRRRQSVRSAHRPSSPSRTGRSPPASGSSMHSAGDAEAAAARRALRAHRRGHLPRAVPAPRGDGADQRHRAIQGRQAHGVGRRAGRPRQQGHPRQVDRPQRRRRDAGGHCRWAGAFGRRLADAAGYLEQAARIAMEMSPHPVKMIWSREEDFAQGPIVRR